MRNSKLQRIVYLVVILMLVLSLSTTAFAAPVINTSQSGSITIRYQQSRVAFSLYRIAEYDASGNPTLEDDFSSYAVSIGTTDAEWRSLASTLRGYIVRDGITPLQKKQTDSDGKASYGELPVGLYLIIGDHSVVGNTEYIPEPFLISLPEIKHGSNQASYEILADVKYETKIIPDEEEVTSITVYKIWDDSNSDTRPTEIAVDLFRNGTVTDTVVLNITNNWRHTWKNLQRSFDWTVLEHEVPNGYTVSVEKEGSTFFITNRKGSTPTPPNQPSPPNLPQTGVLWWPVTVLVCLGIVFFIIGIVRKKCGEADE